MTLFANTAAYLYLVGVLHICGLQAYAFMSRKKRVHVGKFYRYQVYLITAITALMLIAFLKDCLTRL